MILFFTPLLAWLSPALSSPSTYQSMFNPSVLKTDEFMSYINDPVLYSPMINISIPPYSPPNNLIHRAEVVGRDVVMGLASYRGFIKGFRRFVGSLRYYGYDGHIILGVHPQISLSEVEYLKRQNVTFYAVQAVECHESALINPDSKEVIVGVRGKCSADIPDLKLEWGRFEMARRWMEQCDTCTGWAMVMDVRDAFFQDHPFRDLGSAHTSSIDTIFIEEISPYTSPSDDPSRSFVAGNPINSVHTVPCYGRESFDIYEARPVLCSGTVLGTRRGMLHFLSVLVAEFYANNRKSNHKCRSPSTTDQWTMNWLYYHGKFGELNRTVTIPWGMGPVLTVGKACKTKAKKSGATDLIPRNEEGFLLNRFTNSVAPVVHQFDRCSPWINDFMLQKPSVFAAE